MKPPFFAFYPSDFANDINVESMTTLQVGAYMLLLCKAWQADPPASLPTDDQVLARLARVDATVWAEIKAGVLAPFTLGTDGRLHSKRLRQEYDTALKLIRARASAGKKGAEHRWHRGDDGKANGKRMTQPMRSQCEVNGIQSQSQSIEEKVSTKPSADGAAVGEKKPRKKKPPDTVHHQAIVVFREAWSARYGIAFAFDGGKDGDAIKFTLNAVGRDLDRFSEAVRRFLASNDKLIVEKRHSLGAFRMDFNRWVVDAKPPAEKHPPTTPEVRKQINNPEKAPAMFTRPLETVP